MKIHRLRNKTVLKIKNKASDFIKQYSSNTPDAPRGAFLDLKSNIVAVFDQKYIDADEQLVVIEKQFEERLRKHLSKYLFITDTEIITTPYSAYFDLEGDYKPQEGEILIPQKKGSMVLTTRGISENINENDFLKFRLQNHLPLQGVDFDTDFILNVSGDDEYVSYTKGCYLGQEIVARVHFRSKPAKKLTVVAVDELTPDQMKAATSVSEMDNGKRRFAFLFV